MKKVIRDSARAAVAAIVAQQSGWATGKGLRLDTSGWLVPQDADHNLVVPLSAQDRRAFASGAGNELATKMRAPHSSSALAYNTFAAARGSAGSLRVLENLVAPTGTPLMGTPTLSFERKRPTEWRGTPPHLDAEVDFSGDVLAVESKMVETYRSKGRPAESLAPYLKFDEKSSRWLGATRLRRAAEIIATGKMTLDVLDAPQLIKHALGLLRAQHLGTAKPVALVLLWFDARELTDAARPACDTLAAELDWFSAFVAADITLVGVTHQTLIRAYRTQIGATPWVSWLEKRYL